MNAWSGNTVPEKMVHNLSPTERQGAVIFQSKQCRNCHSLGGFGGQRGPDLDNVAARMTEDQLIRQVVQGGGLKVPPAQAVLVNGAMVHQFDFDDTHDLGICHGAYTAFGPVTHVQGGPRSPALKAAVGRRQR